MNYNQNQKLNQLDEQILIIGVEVSEKFHVARAQDYRGVEFKKGIKFDNTLEGFIQFSSWKQLLMKEEKKTKVIVGMEPTAPYWLPFARWLQKESLWIVTVNPAHLKKSKELDDNNQAKTDYWDARVIAQLVKDVRFSEPNLLKGIYEELHNAKNIRKIMVNDLKRIKDMMANWLDWYFPEYKDGYVNWEAEPFCYLMSKYKLPEVLAKQDPEELYKEIVSEIGEIEVQINDLCEEFPEVRKITKIKGMGMTMASRIVAELGEIKKYQTPKQMIKMAGLALTENSSGQRKGKMSIRKRGRKDLRKILYQAVVGMIRTNATFRELYEYYT